ncbi:NADPH-dependent FMN reductase [Rhizosphaericola mali]|uniref:NAD(P)H-dependent oxidoreductase n=1 Tax=Rhizosphaericola mali TaxID=2545455 RepID=A0A5P2G216_9BACT|nr:NADPH-dependent FMN reductase [Rhizosphaericola mali]QES87872.1 NAD(P)H-dependent oxidoreductase [Rhizosphaericola mali]
MKILAIIGSATKHSSNLKLVQAVQHFSNDLEVIIYDELAQLPHFDTELTIENTPENVLQIRQQIEESDGVIISSPEYIFSIPSGLKNLLEWCVSTTIFTEKPVAIITASSSGEKAHEELQLILKTLGAKFDDKTSLLIKGIKGKFEKNGLLDKETVGLLENLMQNFAARIMMMEKGL